MLILLDAHAAEVLPPDLHSLLEVGVLDAADLAAVRTVATEHADGRAYLAAHGGGWIVGPDGALWVPAAPSSLLAAIARE